MKVQVLAALMISALVPGAAFAQSGKAKESLHDQFTGQGYGVAGCGLGSVVFGPKPGMIQVIGATLNGIQGNQTFGISSGTSNCDIPEMGQQAAVFIETNRETLTKEAARGQGATVTGLASIFQCENSVTFANGLQKNYEVIFSQKNSYDATREIMKTINSDSELQASCSQG